MSLTSHLKDPTSPVYRFVRENFPNTRVVVRAANARLQGAQTIRPEGAVHWSTVGTAADYRIRYYLGPAHEAGAARHGARMLEGRMMRAGQLEGLKESEVRAAFEALAAESEGFRDSVPGFFAGLEEILARLRPWQKPRRLGSDDEALLCRHCAVLALFEQVFRVGRVSPGSPLIDPEPARGYDELLARVPDLWVEDLCVLSWSFFDSQEGLMRGAERVALAPTFEGSFDVGGRGRRFRPRRHARGREGHHEPQDRGRDDPSVARLRPPRLLRPLRHPGGGRLPRPAGIVGSVAPRWASGGAGGAQRAPRSARGIRRHRQATR